MNLLCADLGPVLELRFGVQVLGFGVWVDLASASGSLRQLSFHIQYLGKGDLL